MTAADGRSKAAYVIGPFGDGTREASRTGKVGLPYGSHLLADHGYDVTYCDPPASVLLRTARLGWLVRGLHKLTRTPVLAPVLEPVRLLRADLLVCMLEDNLTALAPLVRLRSRLPSRSKRRSLLVVCWLSADVGALTARQRRRWRRRLTSFDRVLVYSTNQIDVLAEGLGLPVGLVSMVPFGVTVPSADKSPCARGQDDVQPGSVLTVGSDRGRDFDTFVTALADCPTPVTILTNAEHARRLGDVGHITVVGPLDRDAYLGLLREAEIFVSPTRPLAYPTGQTALLEAMTMAKACVVSRSSSLDDYVTDGQDVLLVPAHDASALLAAVRQLQVHPELRRALGSAAQRTSARFTEAAMWSAIVASAR